MKKVNLKKAVVSKSMTADEKIDALTEHVNDLEHNLELILNLMNSKIFKKEE